MSLLQSGKTYYIVSDYLGSVIDISSDTGNTSVYFYEPTFYFSHLLSQSLAGLKEGPTIKRYVSKWIATSDLIAQHIVDGTLAGG